MAKVDFRRAAFPEIRRLPKVVDEIGERADSVADASGDGFESNVGQGRTRARASVVAVTPQARRKNAKHNTILSNIGAGRR